MMYSQVSRIGTFILTAILAAAQIAAAQRHITQPHPLAPREIARKALPSVVYLRVVDQQGQTVVSGTGFYVKAALIATNYHVIHSAYAVYASAVTGGQEYLVSLRLSDEKNDIAVLETKGVRGVPLTLSDAQPEIGDPVYAVGNPQGLEGTFSSGILSAYRPGGYIQITAPISRGSSGGPVLNEFGEVIGIASLFHEGGQNLNFAIPVSTLSTLIATTERQPESGGEPAPLATAGPSQSADYYVDLGDRLGDSDQFQEAEEAYRAALRLDAHNVRALNNLGQILLLDGRYEEAIDTLLKVNKIRPDMMQPYFNLGLVLFQLGRYSEAEAYFHEAARLEPKDAEPAFWLGLTYVRLGNTPEAANQWRLLKKLGSPRASELFNEYLRQSRRTTHTKAKGRETRRQAEDK